MGPGWGRGPVGVDTDIGGGAASAPGGEADAIGGGPHLEGG